MLYPFLLSLFLLVAPLEGGDVETKDAFRLHPISYQYSHVMWKSDWITTKDTDKPLIGEDCSIMLAPGDQLSAEHRGWGWILKVRVALDHNRIVSPWIQLTTENEKLGRIDLHVTTKGNEVLDLVAVPSYVSMGADEAVRGGDHVDIPVEVVWETVAEPPSAQPGMVTAVMITVLFVTVIAGLALSKREKNFSSRV